MAAGKNLRCGVVVSFCFDGSFFGGCSGFVSVQGSRRGFFIINQHRSESCLEDWLSLVFSVWVLVLNCFGLALLGVF